MVSVSVRYLLYQPMDDNIKTGTLRFPAKKTPNMEKVLFDCPIVLQYDVNEKYPLISRKFSGTSHWQLKIRIPSGFLRILDLPYLKAGIWDSGF